jgi:hypothetical protein
MLRAMLTSLLPFVADITPPFAFGSSVFAIVMWIAVLAVQGLFAFAVWTRSVGKTTQLVTPPVWAAATLLGGPLVAAAWWVMHESSLAAPRQG